MALYAFDAAKISVWFGPIQIQHFMPGSSIKCSRARDTWKTEVGRDGEVVRKRTKNEGGTFEFNLSPAAIENDLLSASLLTDEETSLVIMPLIVRDGNGGDVAMGLRSWCVGWPPLLLGDEADEGSVWRFECDLLRMYRGSLRLASQGLSELGRILEVQP